MMQIRKLIPAVCSLAMIASVAHGWDPLNSPYGKACLPSGGAETQGMDGGKDVSDPINLATGDFQHVQTDLVIPGRGLDFEIKRFYRSLSGIQAVEYFLNDGGQLERPVWNLLDVEEEAPFGHHWDFNYNMRLSVYEPVFLVTTGDPHPNGLIDPTDPVERPAKLPERLSLMAGTGRLDTFTKYSPAGEFLESSDPAGLYSHATIDLRIEYTNYDEPIHIFDTNLTDYEFFPCYEGIHGSTSSTSEELPYAGRLKSITDRNGNKILFVWETSSQGVERIDYAIDTLLHRIEFVYHDEVHNGHTSGFSGSNITQLMREQLIWRIEDHASRVYEYGYDLITTNRNFPMLTSVTEPAIESTSSFSLPSEHERFESGRTWEYTYNDIDSSLTSRWRGRVLETITSPNGDVIVENTYNTISDFDDPNMLRVMRQRYGNGYYNYLVTDLNGEYRNYSTNMNPQEDYFVWVNDRRGAITRFRYAGEQSTEGFYRELLETVKYDGLVSDPNRATYATVNTQGDVVDWFYVDESAGNFEDPGDPHAGPVVQSGGAQQVVVNRHHGYVGYANINWKTTRFEYPSGDYVEIKYNDHDGIYPKGPLVRGAVLDRERFSADGSESIKESWLYESGLTAGCGCGAGSSNFFSAYKDGEGYVTLRDYNASGDLIAEYHDLPIGTSMSVIPPSATPGGGVDEYTYNQWGQVLTHTHPSKRVYDSASDTFSDTRRIDHYEYYSNPADTNNYGRLYKQIIDADHESHIGFKLTTTYAYDAIGNPIKMVEPDGDVVVQLYNQASQLVTIKRFDSTETELFAQSDFFYDANGNMVQEELMNLDGDQAVDSVNPSITTVYEYDSLNFLTTVSAEAGVFNGTIAEENSTNRKAIAPLASAAFVTQISEYDAGKNLIKISDGEAVSGTQASNVIEYEYNALDLVSRKIEGAGSANELVTKYIYDENDRLETEIVNPGNSEARATQYAYDPFDRVIARTDPMGNGYTFQYDKNDNPIEIRVDGASLKDDEPGGTDSNFMLARLTREYNAQDLVIEQRVELYDYDYASYGWPLASSDQVGTFEYNEDRSVRLVTTPSGDALNSNVTSFYYDTASRLEFSEDGDGNRTQYEYDADSNVAKLIKKDVSTLVVGDEVFEVAYLYDELDRLVKQTDGVGNEMATSYDSRSNPIQTVDARGNITNFTYDALSRLKSTSAVMMDSGDDTGLPIPGADGTITTSSTYDHSSRLLTETDDNGNTTSYEYDGLNRVIKTTMPDGEIYLWQYDDSGNMSQYTDARGVITTNTYDLNDRLEKMTISGTTVPGATSQNFTYDGLGRLRTAENGFAKITREYDSLSNLRREVQNSDATTYAAAFDRVVEYEYDSANNNSKMTYPSGRQVFRAHDLINRLTGVFNDATMLDPVTQFEYTGNRLQRREHGNGTRTEYAYNGFNGAVTDPADQGFGRITSISTTNVASAAVIDGFEFKWDAAQNRTAYNDVGSGMKNRRERSFSYDSANRLVATDVDFPDPLTDFTTITNNGVTDYVLDGVHNRTQVTGFESAGAPIGLYDQAGDQAKNNQYTMTPREAGGEWIYVYDDNGNMIVKSQSHLADFNGDYLVDFFDVSDFLDAHGAGESEADINDDGLIDFFDVSTFLDAMGSDDGTQLENWHYTYDFRNQLIEAKQAFGVTAFSTTTNQYDALDRRVIESIDLDGDDTIDVSRQLVYGGTNQWEVIEQIQLALNAAPEVLLSTHVYGLGIDDEISYRIENDPTPTDIWTHRDDLNSLTSISDDAGVILERYAYGDYGQVSIMDASGVSLPSSAYKAYHLYTGRSQIAGTGLYDYRHRVMEPETGRFIQRDPLGYIDSMSVYAYVISSPYNLVDPYGLEGVSWFETVEMIFTNKSVRDSFIDGAKDGGMAVTDGIIPFADPFKDNGFYDPCDPLLAWSRTLGGIARDLILTAIVPNLGTWIKNPALYEIGAKTLPTRVFVLFEHLTTVERGRAIVDKFGWVRAITPSLRIGNYTETVVKWTGLTPGGYLFSIFGIHALDYVYER